MSETTTAPPPATADMVAKITGISARTIPTAFRENSKLAEATRKRILEAAAAVGYTPQHGGPRPPRGKAKRHTEPARSESDESKHEARLVGLSKTVAAACDRFLASRNIASRGWKHDRRPAGDRGNNL